MTTKSWSLTTDPMTLRRMGKLIEELGELSNVAARVVIQGIDEVDPASGLANRVRLERELADVLAQCHVTIQRLSLDSRGIFLRSNEKMRQMDEWESAYSGDKA